MSTLTPVLNLYRLSFNGRSGAGAVSIPGVKSGDFILSVLTSTGLQSGAFYQLVTTDDEIEQENSSDHSMNTFEAIVLR